MTLLLTNACERDAFAAHAATVDASSAAAVSPAGVTPAVVTPAVVSPAVASPAAASPAWRTLPPAPPVGSMVIPLSSTGLSVV